MKSPPTLPPILPPQPSKARAARAGRGAARRIFDLKADGDSRALDEAQQRTILALSQELIIELHTLMRTANFHRLDNQAARRHLDVLIEAIRQLFKHEYEIHVVYTGTDFLVNDRWTQLGRQLVDLVDKMGTLLIERGIGGFVITAMPTPQQVVHFLQVFLAVNRSMADPFDVLQRAIWQHRIDWIQIDKWEDEAARRVQQLETRAYVRQTYFHAIDVVKQLWVQAGYNKSLKLLSAKRVVQTFVDVFLGTHAEAGSNYLLLLTQIKNWLDYRYNHGVNVSILSIGLAQSIGLPRSALRDIGIAGMLYDIGMARLPEPVQFSIDLTPDQRAELKRHPALAVPLIVNTSMLDSTILRSVNVAFAHHLWAGEGGYPDYGHGMQSLASQIVAICDRYDALTTSRPHRPKAKSPPEALAELARTSTDKVNPVLVRKFIDWMGPLPLGTLVGLHGGELGYVLTAGHQRSSGRLADPGAARMQPIIKVLLPDTPTTPRVINLAGLDPYGLPWRVTRIADAWDPRLKKALIDDLLTGDSRRSQLQRANGQRRG